jgi:predicted ATP-dependent protease
MMDRKKGAPSKDVMAPTGSAEPPPMERDRVSAKSSSKLPVSAVTGRKIRQDVAVTGEISLAGRVRPVGGVFEKAYGAKQAGITTMVIPKENAKDIPEEHLGLSIHPVETAEEAFELIFEQEER